MSERENSQTIADRLEELALSEYDCEYIDFQNKVWLSEETVKKVKNELEEWRDSWYKYSSSDVEADCSEDFQEFNKIINKLVEVDKCKH